MQYAVRGCSCLPISQRVGVERMHAGVAEIAGAVLPEEVPVVVEVILVERSQRRRSQPQVVVHAGGRRAVGHHADRIAAAIDDRLARVDLPEPAVTEKLDGLAEQRPAAALRAGLHDTVVAADRVDHAPAFDDVVADRLFAVDVLASLARHDGHQRVPVIRRGDGHGIDVAVVEHAPEIGFGLRIAAPFALGEWQCRGEVSLVDIDDVGDADILDAGEVLVMVEPAAARGPRGMALVVSPQPDDRDVDGVVRTPLRVTLARECGRHSGGCGGSFRDEHAAVDHRDLLARIVAPVVRGPGSEVRFRSLTQRGESPGDCGLFTQLPRTAPPNHGPRTTDNGRADY